MSCDFPRAWQIARSATWQEHNPKCSFHLSKGGCLCDCHILMKHPDFTDEELQTIETNEPTTHTTTDLSSRDQSEARTRARYFKRDRTAREPSDYRNRFTIQLTELPTEDPEIFNLRLSGPHFELVLGGSQAGIRPAKQELERVVEVFNKFQFAKPIKPKPTRRK